MNQRLAFKIFGSNGADEKLLSIVLCTESGLTVTKSYVAFLL